MKIPAEIHARLSASERIRAAVSAMARNDEGELQTLRETCPKKSYLMNDAAYSDGMERLLSLAMAVESDLQGMALNFLLASRMEVPDAMQAALAEAAAYDTAWKAFLAELGIDHEEMSKAGPSRHIAVATILSLGAGEQDPAAVESALGTMRAYLAA